MSIDSENKQSVFDRLKLAALSGGVTGGGLGGVSSFLGGANPKSILRSVMLGAGTGAVLAPLAMGTGEAVMGEPEADEKNPYTRRGAVGGSLLGGAVGLGGALLLKNKLPMAKLGSLGEKITEGLNSENIVMKKMRDLVNSGDKKDLAAALGIGTTAGVVAGSHFGADEGMGQDVVANELSNIKTKRAKKRLMAGG